MKTVQPCVFTEEEFDKVIKHSERSGNATPAEVKQFFAQWGSTIQYGANKLRNDFFKY